MNCLRWSIVRLVSPSCAAAALLALPVTALAQVPDGWPVVSRYQFQGVGPLGGLTLVEPSGSGVVLEITGLPAELLGTSAGLASEGIASVLVEGRTGNLIVGEHALPGTSTDIHVLSLSGLGVVADDVYTLGVAPVEGWVDQMAWLGDDVVFTLRNNVTTGPMVGHVLGMLRPHLGPPGTPGTIVPVPLTFIPAGFMNALAVDEQQGRAWFGLNTSPLQSSIYEVSVPGDGTPAAPVLVASLPTLIRNLAYVDGRLLAGTNGATSLWQIDLATSPATVSPVSSQFSRVNALAVDHVSGDVLIVDSLTNEIQRRDAAGALTLLGSVASAPSGIAIRQSLAPYGEATAGANAYDWVLAPNPGGSPTIGNGNFSMTIASSPGTAIGVAGLSLGEAATPVPGLGFSLLLDPATLVLGETLLPAAHASVALPIPNVPGLAGMKIYAQAVFLEPSGMFSSRGLRVTVTQ